MSPHIGAEVGPWVLDQVLSFAEPSLALAHWATDPSRQATLELRRASPAARVRQQRALDAMADLRHPHLPARLGDGETGDTLWIAMAPFVGETLADRLEAGGIDTHLACSWLLRIATVLEQAHGAGWLLDGLSPHRVVVGAAPDQVWVLGLERATRPHGPPDPRADVATWGALAYALLTGQPAFPAALRPDAPDDEPAHPAQFAARDPGPDHPDWLRRLVRKCTDPDPARRLPDLDAAIACLEAARPSWERPEAPRPTPMHIPRGALPPLDPRPTFDPEELARVVALASGPSRVDRSLLLLTATAMGCAAGFAASALIVLYVELSRLA